MNNMNTIQLKNYLSAMQKIATSMNIPLADVLSADRNLFLGEINSQVESISDEIEVLSDAVLKISKKL